MENMPIWSHFYISIQCQHAGIPKKKRTMPKPHLPKFGRLSKCFPRTTSHVLPPAWWVPPTACPSGCVGGPASAPPSPSARHRPLPWRHISGSPCFRTSKKNGTSWKQGRFYSWDLRNPIIFHSGWVCCPLFVGSNIRLKHLLFFYGTLYCSCLKVWWFSFTQSWLSNLSWVGCGCRSLDPGDQGSHQHHCPALEDETWREHVIFLAMFLLRALQCISYIPHMFIHSPISEVTNSRILKTLLNLPCKLAVAPGKPPSGPYSSKKLRALKRFGQVVSTLGSDQP